MLLCESGWFRRRINYLNKCRNQINASKQQIEDDNEMTDPATTEKEDFEFLKNVIVNDSNLNLIIEKLNSTRKLRQRMLLAKETDLREHFSYFFSHPKLVSQKYVQALKFIITFTFYLRTYMA